MIALILSGFILLVWMANRSTLGTDRQRAQFESLLVVINLPILAVGLLLAIGPAAVLGTFDTDLGPVRSEGWALITMALAGFLVLLPPVRRLAGRLLPNFRLDSPVHTVALLMAAYLVSQALSSVQRGGVENLAESTQPTSLFDIVFQQSAFLFIALFGVGLATRRSHPALRDRLQLFWPTKRQLAAGLVWVLPLVIFQGTVSAVWQEVSPSESQQLAELNSFLFRDIDTLYEWFGLALATGVAEELLFRAAVQPVFGIWPTAALFAAAHLRYALTPATAVIFLMGGLLGYLKRRHGTVVVMAVHFSYNLVLGLLSLIATQQLPVGT